jgi:predicted ester cyclase
MSEHTYDLAAMNKQLVDDMYGAMNKNVLGLMHDYWFADMIWQGPAGVGTMHGLDEFENVYRQPFIAAFPDKNAHDVVRIAEGDWVAGTGYQTTTFATDWLGIPATGKPIKIRYMDFWRIEEREGKRKLAENLVLIDILDVLEQAGYNVENVLKFIGSKDPQFFEDAFRDHAEQI